MYMLDLLNAIPPAKELPAANASVVTSGTHFAANHVPM